MTRKLWITLAVLGAACGGPEGREEATTGKAEGTGGAEALVFPASARVGGGELPGGEALQVRVWAPTPIGALREDALDAYRIVVQAENTSFDPIDVHPAWARARIHRNDRIVEGCLGEPVAVPETSGIAPQGALFVSLPAPCALEEPGDYEAFVDLSIGAPFGADGSAVRTARTEIVVDGSLEPFRGDELPPVTEEEESP